MFTAINYFYHTDKELSTKIGFYRSRRE